ncbi:MAG: hypothetical protein CL675_00625 [Bdellovibrionaceae bacterium]|nr:hypothetical protein [Pseudobdellovibrionaceae bacterium]
MFLADLHVHSTYSDGQMSLPEIIDFYGSREFGCIAVTDHICEANTLLGQAAKYLEKTLTAESWPFYVEELKEQADRAWKQYQMLVLTGFELSKNSIYNHRSAHILGLDVTNFVPADGDALDLARQIRAQNGLAIAAHPVSTRRFEPQTFHLWNRREELSLEIDAWEVASGPYIFDEVLKSGLPMVASSDLHVPEQISAWKTVFECEKHPEAIKNAIRTQDISFRFYRDKAFPRKQRRPLEVPRHVSPF